MSSELKVCNQSDVVDSNVFCNVAPRRHRLPQRLDWALVPPPLDLSKPIVDDKALLPAIIVTPSSPTCERDFRIAFLANEPKETITSRVITSLHRAAPAPTQLKPRTLVLIFVPLLILFCHVLTHQLAMRRPHLHLVPAADGSMDNAGPGWLDLNDYWGARQARDFVIEEGPVHGYQA
ncbi:hypothetical protein M0805_007312 [Coniferiporia weirii]|nr:hypothetical protein M0805_007312 [Coniferiporia weirii]